MEQFGKYQVVEKIGEGGFGVIFKGFDPLIKRTVAIKTCTSTDDEVRDRFFKEAEIVGNLQHRNITIVYDFGLEDNVPYLIQEYLSGEDLDRKIKRREPMSFGTKLLYLIQVARGLDYAHSKGVIHRDIKPANIRILEDDTVKIMDFGIAKLAHAEANSLTQTGQTIGTAAYLAPEQIRGQPVDHRADIFAFGLLTYELLTGSRAFTGDNPSSVIYKVLTEEPRPVVDYVPDCPPAMLRVLARCIQKDPADRYPGCSDLLADLDGLVELRRDDPAPATSSARHAQRRRSSYDVTTLRSSSHSTIPSSSSHSTVRSSSPHSTIHSSSPHSTIQVADGVDQGIDPGIDQVPLHGERAPAAPLANAGAARARRSGLTAYLILFLLMGLLGAGAWWYWERYLPAQSAPTSAVASQTSPPLTGAAVDPAPSPGDSIDVGSGGRPGDRAEDAATAAGSGPLAAESDAAGIGNGTASDLPLVPDSDRSGVEEQADAADGEPNDLPTAAGEEGEAGPAADDGTTTAEEPPQEPPPPVEPVRGTLVLPQAWDPAMTVSINGGRALVLDREHRLQLPPGRYQLSFDLISRDYQNTGETSIAVAAGQTREVIIPIPRPGRIMVRQVPNSPRGWVIADGEPLGWSPIRERQLAPDRYDLVITRGPTANDDVQIRHSINLRSNRLLIITFDLRRVGPPTVVERPITG